MEWGDELSRTQVTYRSASRDRNNDYRDDGNRGNYVELSTHQ